jgi:hypothetical protein
MCVQKLPVLFFLPAILLQILKLRLSPYPSELRMRLQKKIIIKVLATTYKGDSAINIYPPLTPPLLLSIPQSSNYFFLCVCWIAVDSNHLSLDY